MYLLVIHAYAQVFHSLQIINKIFGSVLLVLHGVYLIRMFAEWLRWHVQTVVMAGYFRLG